MLRDILKDILRESTSIIKFFARLVGKQKFPYQAVVALIVGDQGQLANETRMSVAWSGAPSAVEDRPKIFPMVGTFSASKS